MKLKKELITQKDPKAPISEIFRTLRTNIQFMSTNKKMKTLLITSTIPGEGKSWVASNLAVTFAQAGNKVILIDADMRKGRQYTIFGVSPRPGLSNFLSGIDESNPDELDINNYIKETEIENLYLMPAGNIPPNPSELLVAPQMEELLEDLKEEFDIVIIDGTPCELVTDAVILSRIADSTLIVTAYNSTKKDSLERTIKNIQNVDGNLIGVVINKMPLSTKKYNENYYASTKTSNLKEDTNKKKNENISTNTNPKKKKTNNTVKHNIDKTHKDKSSKQNEDLEKPNFISNKEITEKTMERTKDILDQINFYYEKEEKKEKK